MLYTWEYLTALIRLSNITGEATDKKVASSLIRKYEIYEKVLFGYITTTCFKAVTYKKKKYYFKIELLENTTDIKWSTEPWDQ